MIPSRASSASLIRSVFSSSTLPGAGSAGSAIETPDSGGVQLNAAGEKEGRKEGGRGRAACLVSLLTGSRVSASGAVLSKRGQIHISDMMRLNERTVSTI